MKPRKNEYLLALVNSFTKLVTTVPLNGQSSVEAAKRFVKSFVINYGPSKDLIAYNGKCSST